MGSLISFICLIVSFAHSQLTQSVYSEENCDSFVQTCVQSSFLKDYLQHILRSSQYPESVFIITDCMSSFDVQKARLLAHTPLAIVNVSALDQIRSKIFIETKPFIVLDLSEALIEETTKKINAAYQLTRKWVIEWQPTITVIWKSHKAANEQFNLLQDTFKTTTLYLDTNIFVYFVDPSIDQVTVWDMYNIKLKRYFTAVKTFFKKDLLKDDADKFQLSTIHENLESYAIRRRNFHLESLTASVKFDPNYQDWLGVGMNEDSRYFLTGGYVAVLYWDLKLLKNFSENIILGDSPRTFPNGTVGGVTVGQLNSGEVDLTLNQISFSLQRAKAFTFLQPTYYSLTHAFFKQPSANSIRDIVLAAFQKELWIALIGVWAILVISTKVRLTLPSKNNFPLQSTSAPNEDQKFSNESVLWSVAAFCQKTWHLDPRSTSLRMKFMIGSLVGFLSYTVYSGSIVSSLAVNKIPVKSFVDLINFDFVFTVHEQSEPFQTMLKGLIKSYALKQEVKTISTEKEVSHLFIGSSPTEVQSAKVAFLSPADMFYRTAEFLSYSDSFICDHVSSFSTGNYQSKSAMLVKKDSQFKEMLNYMLSYIRQRGLIYRNIDSYNTKNFLRCMPLEDKGSNVKPATWIDVFTIFIILFSGFFLAILLLTLEIVYIFCSNWKSRSRYKNMMFHDAISNHSYIGSSRDTIDSYYYTSAAGILYK